MSTVAVVVTTQHRAVFFGYIEEDSKSNKTLVLTRARMCVFWAAEVRGLLGLAAHGPTENCRIGPSVPDILLHDVTAVITVTEEAKLKWESAPWKQE